MAATPLITHTGDGLRPRQREQTHRAAPRRDAPHRPCTAVSHAGARPPGPAPASLSLDVDEVPEVLLHPDQLAVVNGVGGVYQRDLFLVHFAKIKILEKPEKLS